MLIPFLIMVREGLEAALIVGIVAGYLRRTGRAAWLPAVWAGVGLAVLACAALGLALEAASAEFPQREQEMFEGAVALAAAAMLGWMVVWMHRAAGSAKAGLHGRVEAALAGDSRRQGLALVGMVMLAVGREGLESVMFLLATFQQDVGWAVPAGALLGLAVAALAGWAIYRGAVRIDLARFFRWTGVFLLFVAAGLVASAVRAFHEAGLWNGLQQQVWDLSAVLPADGPLGTLLGGLFGYSDAPALGELLAWAAFLLPALALFLAAGRPRPQPAG